MQVFSAILNLVTSSFPGLLDHKMYRRHANRSWYCNRRRKRHKTFKIHLPTAEQYLHVHQVNIMLLELDLRILLYFFQKIIGYVKIMFELLHIFTKLIRFPHFVRLCDFFADYAIECGKRSIVRNCTSA